MNTKPKYKRETRAAITQNIQLIKNTFDLRYLYDLVDILSRAQDDEKYKTLTDAEWDIYKLFTEIMRVKDVAKLRRLGVFAQIMLNK